MPMRLRALLLASLSGVMWFLACTPFDLSFLAWIAMLPLLWAVERGPSLRRAALLGWWAGSVATAGGFYWLIDTLHRFAQLPWAVAGLIFALFCAYQGLVFLLFVLSLRFIRDRRRIPLVILGPVLMVAAELVVPVLFPFGLWITQAWQPLVIQIAELTGPAGVTALLLLVNGTIYEALTRGQRAWRPVAGAIGLVVLVLAGSAMRMHAIDTLSAAASHLHVGLVQPNFSYPSSGRISREEALRQLGELQGVTRSLDHLGAELVVWSESAYPATVARERTQDYPEDSPARIRRASQVPLIASAVTRDTGTRTIFNSAWLMDRDGRFVGRYDKVRLLAFGEYLPGIEAFPWLRELMPVGIGQFTAGAGPGVLPLTRADGPAIRLAPVICYEDILPGYLRRVGELHPNLLVNLTSDAWFGPRAEPWEHLALAVFASIELRVSLVRAVDTGISAIIDPNGRLVGQSTASDPSRAPRPAEGLIGEVPLMSGESTAFVRYGNSFAWVCAALTLVLLAVGTAKPL